MKFCDVAVGQSFLVSHLPDLRFTRCEPAMSEGEYEVVGRDGKKYLDGDFAGEYNSVTSGGARWFWPDHQEVEAQ